MGVKITPSSGNVFTDLGFGEEEAEHLRIRSTLMIEVRKLIEERKLTQGEAAKLMGVTQPRISDLVRGKIDLFSIDALVGMLARAGVHVEVVLSTARQGAA
jgi:predicted XRE-type DNA-binding protein